MFKRFWYHLETISSSLLSIIRMFNELLYLLEKPDDPDPPVPPDSEWRDYTRIKMEDWPAFVYGQRVGYAFVFPDKSPLWELREDKEGRLIPRIYEDTSLRNGQDGDGARIIAKNRWVQVYAKGDVYSHLDKTIRPFGQEIDGDDVFYLVMKEQVIDGIDLRNANIPALYVNGKHVDNIYYTV